MSNLPPGVSDHDIPGNRPEDVAAERIADMLDVALTDLLVSFGVDPDAIQDSDFDSYDRVIELLTELILTNGTEVS